jgi:hypothetical protein
MVYMAEVDTQACENTVTHNIDGTCFLDDFNIHSFF